MIEIGKFRLKPSFTFVFSAVSWKIVLKFFLQIELWILCFQTKFQNNRLKDGWENEGRIRFGSGISHVYWVAALSCTSMITFGWGNYAYVRIGIFSCLVFIRDVHLSDRQGEDKIPEHSVERAEKIKVGLGLDRKFPIYWVLCAQENEMIWKTRFDFKSYVKKFKRL